MTRRRVLGALATCGAVLGPGCTSETTPTLANIDEWPPPDRDSELRFWTWQHHWGNQAIAFQHAADLDTIERETVALPEQLRRLQAGQSPDVVHLGDRQFRRALDDELLQPLPTDAMPSWPPEVELRTHDRSFYEADGQYYGLAQSPLAFSLAIHSRRIDGTSSWETLWNEAYAGEIEMPADPVLAGQIAALYTGQHPTDPEDVEAIETALTEQQPLVAAYWTDWRDCWDRFGQGETVAAAFPQPRFCLCSQDVTPIVYDPPEEGVLYSQNVLAIPAEAENPYAAVEFVDWGADFKTGTETGWNADEWRLYHDRPLDPDVRSRFEAIGADLGFA